MGLRLLEEGFIRGPPRRRDLSWGDKFPNLAIKASAIAAGVFPFSHARSFAEKTTLNIVVWRGHWLYRSGGWGRCWLGWSRSIASTASVAAVHLHLNAVSIAVPGKAGLRRSKGIGCPGVTPLLAVLGRYLLAPLFINDRLLKQSILVGKCYSAIAATAIDCLIFLL